ncbi:AAA family ATPase [Legionella quateirensis]|uniref:Endopeptidase Clp ATP-binding subunit B n=1 Tax=Legionella quateirensis TaxID=45072 RepID=A0A378KRC5_9GAMM|nr:AAA family ATPase [Legionella quateirensis]KTD47816.1 endopeptidase Clp ATP-binding subunit B [Legionella quateirensis]STY16709.1 endopeptidase Clp ATP-binding subunit B [Legionella quateirensis]
MNQETLVQGSKWLSDLIRFLPLKSQFILSGNVHDLQIENKQSGAVVRSLNSSLNRELRTYGYSQVLCYDFVNGFKGIDQVPGNQGYDALENLMKRLGLQPINGFAPAGIELFGEVLENLIAWPGEPIALIIDFASRLIIHQNNFNENEHHLFTRALIRSYEARGNAHGTPPKRFFNTILWIVEKESDIPDWLIVGNSKVRHISIPAPDYQARHALASSLVKSLEGAKEAPIHSQEIACRNFVDNTDGLLLSDLMLIAQLCREEQLGYAKIGEAVRRYKVGVSEDPWQKIDRQKIRDGESFIMQRVKGQDHAVAHMLDIIKRSITGVGTPRRGGRPRGVAFLAGPTGVGKTELAKSVTNLLFGDDSAYIRFDMSEFSAEHSDQRLIGAPPGYIGYDLGGELTNAIREKPFSVVLFDEIEKAHPKILDKFLQILDDGVLTSGRGERVYFTEAFIVFTSNLGVYRTDTLGERKATVAPTDSFEIIQQRIREEIDKHFKLMLNRPEILNRIGDNIIVFDFIRDGIAEKIFNSMIDSVLMDLNEFQSIDIDITPSTLQTLKEICLKDLSNGGRGIRNKIETHLVNPLSRALFDQNIESGSALSINNIEIGAITKLGLTHMNSNEGAKI